MSPTKHEDETAKEAIKPEFLKGVDITPGEEKEMEDAAYSGAVDDIADHNGLSNTEIAAAESGGGENEPTQGDNAESDKVRDFYKKEGGRGPLGRFFGSKKGKWIGVGVGGGIAGVTMFGFFLMPLKVMHMAENLQKTFFASSEEAAENMTNRLLAGYVIKHVMPGMTGSCTTTKVDKSCAVVNDDDNYVTQLYRAWRDNNLEGKLAEQHGLEIQKEGGKYKVITGTATLSWDVDGDRTEYESKMWKDLTGRKEVRREFLKAVENETFYKRIMYRFKYGGLMERKYGIVRCMIACEYRNDRADRKELRKMKMNAWLVQRVVTPMNEGYGLAFECAINGFDCASEDSYETSEDGDRRAQFERDLRSRVGDSIGDGRMTKEQLAKLQTEFEGIRSEGLSNHMFKKVFGPVTTKIIGNAIPGLGLLDGVARIIAALEAAGPAVKTMNYVLKSQAYVQTYMMYRTNADEIRAGSGGIGRITSAEEVGFIAESLGDDFGTDQNGGGMESSPYYQEVMGTSGSTTASLFPKAQAADVYTCNDGSSIKTGLCPEMVMGAATTGAEAVASLSGVIQSIPGLGALADAWLSTGGRVFDEIGDLLGGLAGALTPQALEDKAAELGKKIAGWIGTKLIINPVGESPSGGRMHDMAAMGANVAANDYAHYGLGAAKISDQAANEMRYARAIEERQDFLQKPLLARLFDSSDNYSTVSQLALAMPTGTTTNVRSLSSTLLNPFSMVSSSMGGSKKVNAGPTKDLDMGGVAQYGYPSSHEIFGITDYEKYWTDNECDNEEKVKAWGDSAQISSRTGMPENTSPFPCKLLGSAVSMNGAYFSDEFLTAEELGNVSDSPSTTEATRLRVGSFNILHPPDGDVMARLERSMRVIMEDHDLDIVGLQETRDLQQNEIRSRYAGPTKEYSLYPERPGVNPESVVLYKNDKFELLSAREEPIKYDGNRSVNILRFKSKETGATFYFMNTHDPINRRAAGSGPENRKHNAELYARLIDGQLKEDPTILVGDFNSNYKDSAGGVLGDKKTGLAYCILTQSGSMWNVTDAVKNKTGQCPSENDGRGRNRPDHIYISTKMQASSFGIHKSGINVHSNQEVNGSDHDTVYADVTLPGAGNVPSWTQLPVVDAPIGGPVHGTIDTVAANIKHGSDVPRALGIIKSRSPDFITLNEVRDASLNAMEDGAYGAYRDEKQDRTAGGIQALNNVIMWKKDKWKLLDSGRMKITDDDKGYLSGKAFTWDRYATWGVLKRNDGAIVSIISTHMMTNPKKFPRQHGNPPMSRVDQYAQSMDILLQLTATLAKHGPVIVGGDMNSHPGDGPHSAVAKFDNAGFGYAKDKGVMYVFHPPGTKLQSSDAFPVPSDHDAILAKVDMNGTGPGAIKNISLVGNTGGGSPGWSWPLKRNVNPGPCYGGKNEHAGMDMNSETTDNTVYAMHSGKVVRRAYDNDAGNFITILADAKFNGKSVYYSYEHLKSGSMKVRVGDKVKGGEAVAIAGLTGNVDLDSSRAHLHIVTATTNTLGAYGSLGTTFNPMSILKNAGSAPEGYSCTISV